MQNSLSTEAAGELVVPIDDCEKIPLRLIDCRTNKEYTLMVTLEEFQQANSGIFF